MAAVLWISLFRPSGGSVPARPTIPPVSSQSIFAPAIRLSPGLAVRDVVRNDACTGCIVRVGSGGLVQARIPSGAGKHTAYALLGIGGQTNSGQVLVHDVIGFGRGDSPARPVHLLQLLDSGRRVIFELVAQPSRRLYLTSPAGGLRATPLALATRATVPNDGIAGVAVDVAAKLNGSVAVSVNGVRTAAVRTLAGATTGPPRFLAAGVIGYTAPPGGAAITVTHTQVSVSTSPTTVAAPAAQPVPAAQPSSVTPAPPTQPAKAPPPLSSLTPPTVSGLGIVGNILTAAPGSWTNATATFTYIWERCDGNGSCTSIDGADATTYTLERADRNAFVRVRVTAHAGDESASKASAAIGPISPEAPTELSVPSISGDAIVGAQLTADPGVWSDPDATFTYAWQRCDDTGTCTTIPGADQATYTLSSEDLGDSVRAEVTASNSGGANTADSAPTNVVVPAAPTVVTAPSIDGDAMVGSTLTADPGTWSDPTATISYVWLRCHGNGACTPIDGADGQTYTLGNDDLGHRIEVTVTATNDGGAGTADSAPTEPVRPPVPTPIDQPSVTGDPSVDSTLTADPGTWSDPAATFTYAWQRCDGNSTCTPIDGATGNAYTLTTDDLGYWVGVQVTATGASGTGNAGSNLIGPVVLTAPPALISAPSVTGDPFVGSILTADPGIWSDPAAIFTFAWLRCQGSAGCTTIDGADGETYTLVTDDLGNSMRVEVTASNAGGSTKAQSAPTDVVKPATHLGPFTAPRP